MGQQQEILELMVKQEKTVGKLYHTYKNIFPEEKIWTDLQKAEGVHASWLSKLAKNKKIIFNQRRFSKETIEEMINYVDQKIKEAPEYDILKALSIAHDIEESLLEKKYFEIFDTDSFELKKVFSDLARETKEHRDLIKKLLEDLKKIGY